MELEREADEDDGATNSPLMQSLLPVQVDLLKLVWDPIVRADMWGIAPDWPVWDYVARELHRQRPDLDDAADVLDSLPQMPLPIPFRDHPYGLVWRASQAMRPDPGERIGLSIAGLTALSVNQGVQSNVPDQLARLIAQLADWENGLTAKPNEIAQEDVLLARFTSSLTTPTSTKLYVFSDRAIAGLLQHEYAPTRVFPYDSDTAHRVQLGRHFSLRQYRNITTARGYLERVAADDAARTEPVRYSSPLTLIQTFDYLAYVLAADPEWPKGTRLTAAPDLQSAGAVSASVTDQHDFQTALSGLCTVIDQLAVPLLPEEALAKLANVKERDAAQRTVNRLEYWLANRLADSGGLPRVTEAIGVLRGVRAVRVEAQHRSTSTQNNAIRAHRRLGLPDIISDWSAAWHRIQSQLAGALDVIRQEVQTAPHQPNDQWTPADGIPTPSRSAPNRPPVRASS